MLPAPHNNNRKKGRRNLGTFRLDDVFRSITLGAGVTEVRHA